MKAPTPRYFTPSALNYKFQFAECPKWLAFLKRNLEDDLERIALLQEWCGYCLVNDTSLQKFLVLEGEGANGKSVACSMLVALLGECNVAHVPLEAFGMRFQLTPTLGKLANIASEVGEIDKVNEGFLKAFTGGDPMMFDRKGLPPVNAAPTARLVLATNNRPRFSDRSGGLWRRMLLVPFRVVIPEAERVMGMDKPGWWVASGELPGIFRWALAGLYRLREMKRFTEPAICRDALSEYRAECNPAGVFLGRFVRVDASTFAVGRDLYQDYRNWCISHGYHPLADGQFGKEIVRSFPNMKPGQETIPNPEDSSARIRVRVYRGLCRLGLDEVIA